MPTQLESNLGLPEPEGTDSIDGDLCRAWTECGERVSFGPARIFYHCGDKALRAFCHVGGLFPVYSTFGIRHPCQSYDTLLLCKRFGLGGMGMRYDRRSTNRGCA